ncbi:50S ribosomal protein L17, partial [candidate division WOR-3 bacterium]|nr:50S ribosomal protein L17 [candidate division WOR-3 bacterium]
GDKVKKLGRTATHRRALMRNLVSALVRHERIRTTISKAKVAQQLAERLLRFAALNTLAARREAFAVIADKTLVKKLFDDIGPRLAARPGGRTRVLKLGPRPGDSAEMALLELVVRKEPEKEKAARAKAAKAKGKPARPEKKATARAGGQ